MLDYLTIKSDFNIRFGVVKSLINILIRTRHDLILKQFRLINI